MTQNELQKSLGNAMEQLDKNLKDGKYNEKVVKTIQTMCSVAKQMVNNADVIIRASKITSDKESVEKLFKN